MTEELKDEYLIPPRVYTDTYEFVPSEACRAEFNLKADSYRGGGVTELLYNVLGEEAFNKYASLPQDRPIDEKPQEILVVPYPKEGEEGGVEQEPKSLGTLCKLPSISA